MSFKVADLVLKRSTDIEKARPLDRVQCGTRHTVQESLIQLDEGQSVFCVRAFPENPNAPILLPTNGIKCEAERAKNNRLLLRLFKDKGDESRPNFMSIIQLRIEAVTTDD